MPTFFFRLRRMQFLSIRTRNFGKNCHQGSNAMSLRMRFRLKMWAPDGRYFISCLQLCRAYRKIAEWYRQRAFASQVGIFGSKGVNMTEFLTIYQQLLPSMTTLMRKFFAWNRGSRGGVVS